MHIYCLISRVIRVTRAGILVALRICETETIDRSMQLFREGEKKGDCYVRAFVERRTMIDEIISLSPCLSPGSINESLNYPCPRVVASANLRKNEIHLFRVII